MLHLGHDVLSVESPNVVVSEHEPRAGDDATTPARSFPNHHVGAMLLQLGSDRVRADVRLLVFLVVLIDLAARRLARRVRRNLRFCEEVEAWSPEVVAATEYGRGPQGAPKLEALHMVLSFRHPRGPLVGPIGELRLAGDRRIESRSVGQRYDLGRGLGPTVIEGVENPLFRQKPLDERKVRLSILNAVRPASIRAEQAKSVFHAAFVEHGGDDRRYGQLLKDAAGRPLLEEPQGRYDAEGIHRALPRRHALGSHRGDHTHRTKRGAEVPARMRRHAGAPRRSASIAPSFTAAEAATTISKENGLEIASRPRNESTASAEDG